MLPVVRLLKELVALPSVNPRFIVEDPRRAGEQRVELFLADLLKRLGLDIEFQEVFAAHDPADADSTVSSPGESSPRRNVLGRLQPRGKARLRVLLAPHMDTVDGRPNQFKPRVKGGRLYGRGACDTKGSVASMLTALGLIATRGARPSHTEIVFAGLVDEEHGQSGSRALAASGFRADMAIVGEPTNLRLVTAHKGDIWLKIETRGRSAHGAQPELGRNAVHTMARVVDVLETTYARSLRARSHPLLGHATISVGMIRGGAQPNIVPDHCVAYADRRTLPGETEAGVRREIQALLRAHGLRASMGDSKLAPCLPLETDPALPLVRQLMACAHQRRPAGVHYFCDASVLGCAGVPSVVFGPGNIAQAHTADEWVSISQLEQAVATLGRFLEELP